MLTENIILVNKSIQPDPAVMKLIVTRSNVGNNLGNSNNNLG